MKNQFELIPGFTGELAMLDRQKLDDAVLEMLGIVDASERRALLVQLYTEVTEMYRDIRKAEKQSQKMRRAHPRRKRPTPQKLAQEIWSRFNGESNEESFHLLAAERTSDEALQKKIVVELWRLWRQQNKAKTMKEELFFNKPPNGIYPPKPKPTPAPPRPL